MLERARPQANGLFELELPLHRPRAEQPFIAALAHELALRQLTTSKNGKIVDAASASPGDVASLMTRIYGPHRIARVSAETSFRSSRINLPSRMRIQAGKMNACLAMPLPMSAASRSETAEPADNDLVRRAAGGDMRAFETLYRRHAGRVHGAVWRLSGMNEARAQELTQEAFVRAWQKLDSFRFESAFTTWLHRLAVNVALMDLRGRAPEDAVEDETLEAVGGTERPFCAGERADLERAVAALPPRARAVLVLHDVEGWKHEEIGRELGMAVGSSKAQLHRARGLLRTMLGEAA